TPPPYRRQRPAQRRPTGRLYGGTALPEALSGRFRAAEQAGRQEQQRLQEGEDRLEGDSQQPERQRHEADEGIEDQRQQGHGPADDEEEQPHEKLEHRQEPPSLRILRVRWAGGFDDSGSAPSGIALSLAGIGPALETALCALFGARSIPEFSG